MIVVDPQTFALGIFVMAVSGCFLYTIIKLLLRLVKYD